MNDAGVQKPLDHHAYDYDALYRLTSESRSVGVSPTSSPTAGTFSYSYDPVGNRISRTTTGPVSQIIPNQSESFNANDQLGSASYDANGNTISSQGSVGVPPASSSSTLADIYSFDNKLIRRSTPDSKTIDLIYNTEGHRLTKLISENGLTTRLTTYLTDSNNPTGYSQVIEENDPLDTANPLRKVNLYGHDLISSQGSAGVPPASSSSVFYQYDGLGSVRSITDENGDLQETYDYDAYGTLIGLAKRNATTGVLESSLTANNPSLLTTSQYLYTGEQWDADLGMYFLRARYLSTNTGRFHTLDTYEGRNGEPLTLHKYLYVHGNPVMMNDPSGEFSLGEMSQVNGSLMQNLGQAFSNVGRGILRQLKERVWTVKKIGLSSGFPYFEHTFIWAKKRESRIGIGYHIFSTPDYLNYRAAVKSMSKSRTYNILVDGIFAILPQESPESLLGVPLKVASEKLVTLMTNLQFAIWNIWATNTIADFYLKPEGRSYPYKYNVDECDCKLWSEEAERKARLIS